MASAAPAASPEAPTAPRGGRFGLGALLGIAVLSMSLAGGGAWFVFGRGAADKAGHEAGAEAGEHAENDKAPPAPAVYLPLDPAFVVNLEDPDVPHYLQVDVQLMGRDAAALDAAKAHVPLIRNTLLMLFGQQKPSAIATREGKEALQKAALEEVRKVLQAETGKPVVEAVYFTSFVMQ